MNEGEKKQLSKIVAGMAELMNREMSPIAISLFVKAVEDLPFAEVSEAFSDSVRGSRFFPAPAEIRERVVGTPEKLEDLATIEAAKAVSAIKQHGAYKSVVFDDPVTMAVVTQQFGGWERFCEMKAEEEKFWRKDFAKAYCTFSRAGLRGWGVLYGRHDRLSSSAGRKELTEPVLIGDRQKALGVWEGEYNFSAVEAPRNVKKLLEMVGSK